MFNVDTLPLIVASFSHLREHYKLLTCLIPFTVYNIPPVLHQFELALFCDQRRAPRPAN